MRPEQQAAVDMTAGYFYRHEKGQASGTTNARAPKFLWNAKMRFGKTFASYQLARAMGWRKVLVLTYKPAVQAAWHDDLMNHVDFKGWRFIDQIGRASCRESVCRYVSNSVVAVSLKKKRKKKNKKH